MAEKQNVDVEEEVKYLEQQGQDMEKLSKDTEKSVDLLTQGIVSAFLPQMDSLKSRERELTQNQGILMETMEQENAKFSESQEAKALIEVISQIQKYGSKLNIIQHDMKQINERIARLKRRAHKLKQHKEKNEQIKFDAKKRQQEIEQELIAKLATGQKA